MSETSAAMGALLNEPIEALSAAVRSGTLDAVDLTRAALERIEETDEVLNAFVRTDGSAALEQAAELDRRRDADEALGALAGVPVALKDNLSIAGRPLTCGSRILSGYTAPYDATVVARLRAADAVLVGQANMDEFAMGSSCENSAFGPTLNPWNHGKVPGGSSGGSAAAVAAGAVPLALGSDTGGSVRQPAALCGVVGFKPSYGRVSRYGLVAFASSLDQVGPLTRSVEEAATVYRVIAGPDPLDSTCSSRSLPADDVLGQGLEGLRVGRVREIDTSMLAPDAASNWEQALEMLAGAGAEIVDCSIPSLPAAIAVYYVVANSEASANLARFDGVRYGRRAQQAPTLRELYFRSRSDGFGSEVKRRILLGTFALSSGYYDAYYAKAVSVARTMAREFETAFADVDVIVTPTSPTTAFGLGERTRDPLTMYLSDVFTTPANLCGLPALSVPSGTGDEGLPLALQFIGRGFDDDMVLRAGRGFEDAVGWNRRLPDSPNRATRATTSS